MATTDSTPLGAFLTAEAWQALATHLRLSPRELEIIRGVWQDQKECAIAKSLNMSPHTLRTHMARAYVKLGVGNRVELMLVLIDTFLGLTIQPESPLPPICGRRSAGRCPFDTKRPMRGAKRACS
jgi:DNA-binding CsgD family transcriptional regulator